MIADQIALAVFVIGSAIAAYAFVGYPCITFLLAWLFDRRIERSDIQPHVTFIISVFNEADSLGQKLRETLRLNYPRHMLEVIVASDGSTDLTDEIARAYHHSGVRLIRTEGRVGKTATLNTAIESSGGDIIICSDATSWFGVDSIRELVANFADPTVGGVSGRVVYRYGDSLLSRGFRSYQQFIIRQRVNESRFGHQTQLSGAIHAIRRRCHVPCPPDYSTEEWNAFQIALQGMRTVYEPAATAEEESRTRAASEFNARVRMAIQCIYFTAYSLCRGFTRTMLLYSFQNLSSKIVRWVLPYILLSIWLSTLFLASTSAIWLLMAIGITCAVLLAGICMAFPRLTAIIPGLPLLAFFSIVMSAFATAWVKCLFGGTAPSWTPERHVGKGFSTQGVVRDKSTHHHSRLHD